MSARCETFCTEPLDIDADPPQEDWKNMCSACAVKLHHLCHEVLPAIRRGGYYAPPDATADDELRALAAQEQARPRMREALRFLDGVATTDGRTLGEIWPDERWRNQP